MTESFWVIWDRDNVIGLVYITSPPVLVRTVGPTGHWVESPDAVEVTYDPIGEEITRNEAEKILAGWGVQLPATATA